jgi:tripartite-type tricarboxylate transporter receptor subunit TctC
MNCKARRTAACAFALAALCAMGTSWAQQYPSRPLRIVDGFPPGGAADYLARVVAPKLTTSFGRQVVVENRPGAGGNVGADYVAKSAPDGYTLFMGLTTALAPAQTLYPKLAYNVATDFAPIGRVAYGMNVLVAHPSLPVRSVKELVALAKARPGELNYGSGGVGAGTHLSGELFASIAGINLQHIAYKGGPPAVTALISGECELAFMSVTAGLPQINAKRVRPLAVTGAKRDPTLPNVPTIAESGYPAYDVTSTFGLYAPAGTPREIISLLNAEARKAIAMPDVVERFASQGFIASYSTPEELGAILAAEIEKWTKALKAAGIRIN